MAVLIYGDTILYMSSGGNLVQVLIYKVIMEYQMVVVTVETLKAFQEVIIKGLETIVQTDV